MTTAVIVALAAILVALAALGLALQARSRYEHGLEQTLERFDAWALELSNRVADVVTRAGVARRRGVGDLDLLVDLGELLDHVVAAAAERTGALAAAIRVEGPGQTEVVTAFGADEGAALLELAPLPADTRPFRAFTIGWTFASEATGDGSAYRSALVVPLVEEGRQTGTLVACAAEVDGFRPEHVQALEQLAGEAARAVGNARRLAEATGRAATDPLTGIRNRMGFEVELEREVARARRSGRPLSLLVLRVPTRDGTPSGAGGDDGLPELAALVARVARRTDVPCRPRDRDLAVVLPDTKAVGAHRFLERLRAEARPALDDSPPPTVSVGLVEWRPNETSASLSARGFAALRDAAEEPLRHD